MINGTLDIFLSQLSLYIALNLVLLNVTFHLSCVKLLLGKEKIQQFFSLGVKDQYYIVMATKVVKHFREGGSKVAITWKAYMSNAILKKYTLC